MSKQAKTVTTIRAATPSVIGIYQVNFDPSVELHSAFDRVAPGTIVIQTGALDADCVYTCGPREWRRGCGPCEAQNWHEITLAAAVP